MGKVDVCAGESVRDVGRGDAYGWVSASVELGWMREVMGLGVGIGNALRAMYGGSECDVG